MRRVSTPSELLLACFKNVWPRSTRPTTLLITTVKYHGCGALRVRFEDFNK